jgi:hypothetical protein
MNQDTLNNSRNSQESEPFRSTYSIAGPVGSTFSVKLPKKIDNFEDFCRADIVTGDIDPTYWAITKARHEWGQKWAVRFCVGMLTYYHMGTAVQAAEYEGKEFWDFLFEAYKTAPRAAERRHFRGEAGIAALRVMESRSPDPNKFFEQFSAQTYVGVKAVCEKHLAQFGPYFQLKVCDYMDRCLTMPIISYAGLEANLPTLPAKAVALMIPRVPIPLAFKTICHMVDKLELLAPPLFERPLGPAEVETILCDWKRAKTGSSWLGADVVEKRIALKGYGDRAMRMMDFLPPVTPRHRFELAL